MFFKLNNGKIPIGESYIDYAAFGKGSRALVIIPGLSLRDVRGAGAALALMYRIFAKDFRVYVIDKKRDIPEGYSVSDIARDTKDAMLALGIERASVLGVSLGGMVASDLAINNPDLVESLVLGVTASRTNPTIEAVIGRWCVRV